MLSPPAAPAYSPLDGDIGKALADLVANNGSAGHPHVQALAAMRPDGARDTAADAVHYLCILHGRQPSLAEAAAAAAIDVAHDLAVSDWLTTAARAFTAERQWISQMVVAAGPPPAEVGQINSEEMVGGQKRALLTLVRSDRRGCLVGAIAAVLLDWIAIEPVIKALGRRVGLERPGLYANWPSAENTLEIVRAHAQDNPAVTRAILFAARHLIAQHRAFWDLLEARQAARVR